MKRVFFLIACWAILQDLCAQSIPVQQVDMDPIVIEQGNGTSSKRLLSAQAGNPNQRILTANISCFPDATDVPTANVMAVCTTACNIWAERINSSQPIKIRIKWKDLGTSSGAITTWYGYMPGSYYAPVGNAAYPICLVEKLVNTNANGSNEEFTITVNSNAGLNYYYGTDGNCPVSGTDMLTVVLHEIGHGLGFSTSVGSNGSQYGFKNYAGNRTPTDTYIENYDGTTKLTSLASYTQEFTDFVFSERVFFKGPSAQANNYTIPVKFWASNSDPLIIGSVISHMDEFVFGKGMENSLMSAKLGRGEVIHDIGNTTLGVLQDIGWDVNYITYNIKLDIGKMNGTTFSTAGAPTTFCEGQSGYSVAVQPTQNNGSTVTVPNGNVKWNLYAYHTGGKEEMLVTAPTTGNVNTNTSLSIKTLPAGKVWQYNADGTILGELRATAIGSDGNSYTTALKVSIVQKPATPVLTIRCCYGKQIVSYRTDRASSYEVYRNNTLVYTGTVTSYNFIPVRYGINNFYVKAINCAGTATSASGYKNCYSECDGFVCAFHDECAGLPIEVARMAAPEEDKIKPEQQQASVSVSDSKHLHIILPSAGMSESYQLSIYAMDGKVLFNRDITSGDVDISNVAKGMYIVAIRNNSDVIFRNKIIIP